jgi:hypothetical protein
MWPSRGMTSRRSSTWRSPDEQIQRLYLKPAYEEMKQQLESRAALFAKNNTPNVFGVLGTNPTASTRSSMRATACTTRAA